MSKNIKCDICKKEIKTNDEILLGSKDDYATLPEDIMSSNVVFLHTTCFKEYQEGKKNDRE